MMNVVMRSMLAALVSVLMLGASAQAEENVKVSGMHLCCGACFKGVDAALEGVEGLTASMDKDSKVLTLSGADAKTVRTGLRALAKAGYHGETDHAKIKMAMLKNLPEGKVSRLEVAGAHNCCGGCCKAIKDVVASVGGVTADTCAPKGAKFVVEGSFDASELIAALNKAGFHATVPGTKKKAE